MTLSAVGVRSDLIPITWPLIEPWVADALEKGKAHQASDEVRQALERSKMQLWLAWDENQRRALGCCITEIIESHQGKTCGLVVVAGLDFKKWRPLTETIKAWATENGCVRLEACGREGWQKYVRNDGWKRIRTVIELRLDDDGRIIPNTDVGNRPVGADAEAASEERASTD